MGPEDRPQALEEVTADPLPVDAATLAARFARMACTLASTAAFTARQYDTTSDLNASGRSEATRDAATDIASALHAAGYGGALEQAGWKGY